MAMWGGWQAYTSRAKLLIPYYTATTKKTTHVQLEFEVFLQGSMRRVSGETSVCMGLKCV